MKYKKLYLLSLGCPKNLVDSEVMLGMLGKAGYLVCNTPEDADLLLVNTCGFIRPAVEEGIDEILTLAQVKAENPGKKLVVTGCLVQRYGHDLLRELPEVDLFIGTNSFQDIVRLVETSPAVPLSPVNLHPASFLLDSATPRRISTPSHRAYLKIAEGCVNRCSYCLIPAIRGPLQSRTVADLVSETERLDRAGVRELTLIAQDLTAYGLDSREKQDLVSLLKAILNHCEIPWLRLLYLHPARVDERLLELMASNPRLLPYLDIPLQHVNSRILRAMHRQYDRSAIEILLKTIRQIIPQAAIRTTFISGFPGETEDDARELEEFVEQFRFEHVGVFAYSNEDGSGAAKLTGQVPEEIAEERRRRLMKIQSAISLARHRSMVGRIEKVLVEGISAESDLLVEGRTRCQAPEIDGCVYITAGQCGPGEIVDVRLTEAHPYDLVGEIYPEADL